MIHSLLLTYVLAASQPQVCEHIFDQAYCTGQPALGAPGFVCMWQPGEFECKAVNMNNPEEACKTLSRNQAACQAKPECRYDPFDGECKGMDMGDRPDFEHGRPGVLPSAQIPSQGVLPMTLPGTGTSQTSTSAPVMPVTSTPRPVTSTTRPLAPQSTAHPNQRSTTSTTRRSRPLPPASTPYPAARFCKALTQVECFGPSSRPGKICYWDAEDMECSAATQGSIEAVCKQFARDPAQCDAHENCFWDAKDYECSEIEYGRGFRKPILTQQCSTFRSLNDCASVSSCFWDTTSNLCVNVVQATNVCGVYNTPVLCATNRLCHFRNGVCSLDQQTQLPGRAGLHLQSVHEDTPADSSASGNDYVIMFACGFSGSLLGLLFALGAQKLCQRKVSQEDYRDIVLDVNSHRRQVV